MSVPQKLSEALVAKANLDSLPGKFFDGGGLFCMNLPSGRMVWRLKYRFQGREKQISLGWYPEVSLQEARSRRDEARALLGLGLDPSTKRRDAGAATGEGPLDESAIAAAVLLADGSIVIRKDGAALRVTPDEAATLHSLLGKLLGR
ncbi:protein of unknown function DUF4102 [Alkalidesulfovibrio alkalitolerans DSM 16529]|uniref:Integrase DNA-binding domain-containing protein n=1 Tax=Alkalidesulfovibrio alkalitolerans DSM 16529 TaxID=1121439 RepID=S7SZY8_9BACT|nr:Arm DNA-binding domain-containing protein [Alkalidesulfovibrio alkalitolerans]EPR30387.1 protein of unknown function DUF4102 [Alkalidesulfovibrio alkalitolerans DSM 16529]